MSETLSSPDPQDIIRVAADVPAAEACPPSLPEAGGGGSLRQVPELSGTDCLGAAGAGRGAWQGGGGRWRGQGVDVVLRGGEEGGGGLAGQGQQ